jgi:hypothetical protein
LKSVKERHKKDLNKNTTFQHTATRSSFYLYFWIMTYGICGLSLVPLREVGQFDAPLISEVLYGELFEVINTKKKWSNVKLADGAVGWIDNAQYIGITDEEFSKLSKQEPKTAVDLVEFILKDNDILFPISIGSTIENCAFLGHRFEGQTSGASVQKKNIPQTAFTFLNTPYRKGGKSPFGIDCSGFVQCDYQLHGVQLPRDAYLQAAHGETLGFVDESEPGDLAFFDNDAGKITHVGIIMQDYHIIHAFGQVRIDLLDQTGIFNNSLNTHTHKLRVIKKIM